MDTLKLTNKPVLAVGTVQGSRERQEDHYSIRQAGGRTIAVVCDGMGGMQGGSQASRFAAEQMAETLERVQITESMHGFWKRELEKLDDGVFGLCSPEGLRLGAGTTISAVLLKGGRLHWFSVGDSRILYLRGRRLHCVTREHNYALLGNGAADMENRGLQLVSYLGMGAAELFDGSNSSFITRRGDRLLLCTDGLWKSLPQEKIAGILGGGEKAEIVRDRFAEALQEKNDPRQDNATWVVIDI